MRSQVSNINTKIFHALHRNFNVHALVCLRTVRSKLYLSVSHSDPFFPSLPLLTYLKNLQGELIVQHCILMFHIFNYSGEFPMAVCHWLCHADRPTVAFESVSLRHLTMFSILPPLFPWLYQHYGQYLRDIKSFTWHLVAQWIWVKMWILHFWKWIFLKIQI